MLLYRGLGLGVKSCIAKVVRILSPSLGVFVFTICSRSSQILLSPYPKLLLRLLHDTHTMASTSFDRDESSVMSSTVHDASVTTETAKSVKLDAGLRSLDHCKKYTIYRKLLLKVAR